LIPETNDPKEWSIGDNLLLVVWLVNVLAAFYQFWVALYPEDEETVAALKNSPQAVEYAKEAIRALLEVPAILKSVGPIEEGSASLAAARAKLEVASSKLLAAKDALVRSGDRMGA
jgi:hypothetical protein